MTSPNPDQVTNAATVFAVSRLGDELVCARIWTTLQGCDKYERFYSADVRVPEEAAAFYDDVSHEIRSWSKLLLTALEDVSCCQPSLF
jgi:hypothetical protein